MTLLQVENIFKAPNDSVVAAKAAAASDLSQLENLSLADLINKIADKLVNFAINLAIAIFVFYVGKFIINKIHKLVAAIFLRRNVDQSLSTFVLSLIRIVLYFILIVTVIGILGVETTSFLALFASAGVAIGMALSGTLQNFAGGVLILLLKPYKIGDYIEAQGYAGTVREIQIFHTILNTPDNKSISIPNGGLSTSSVNNWSREDYRRVQWDISISYGDSVEAARAAILAMLAEDDRIVKRYIEDDREDYEERVAETQPAEPEPKRSWLYRLFHHRRRVADTIQKWEESREAKLKALRPKADRSPQVRLAQMADSSINLIVRAWVRTENYWAVFYDFNEKFYTELPRHGLNFPFPQMDIHIQPNT